MPKTATNLDDLETRIFTLRGVSALLDSDLAQLYGVDTKALLQAMRRNRNRFPQDFVFSLTEQEVEFLRSQLVTSKPADGRGGRRYVRYAFTEQGVAMLSSVLRSETAVQVNIAIMRAFVRLRRASLVSAELMKLIEDLSERVDSHDTVIGELVEAIRQLAVPASRGRSRPIGFTADLDADSKGADYGSKPIDSAFSD